MKIECHADLTDEQLHEWRGFLAVARHQHPRQDPRFAEVERATGRTVIYAMGREDGRLVAVGMFALQPGRIARNRYSDAFALSGPVCDDAAQLVAFVEAVGSDPAFAKVDTLKVTPYWLGEEAEELDRQFASAGFVRSDPEQFRDTGLIDLTPTEDELRDSFSKSARRKVRLIEKSEVEVRQLTTLAEAGVFFDRLNKLVIERHNLTPVSRNEYEAGFNNVYNNPEAGVIFGAFHGGTFLGGLLLYRSNITAHARRYVADPGAAAEVNNLRVAPALWLEGMFWAKRQGCTAFDVEGFLPVEDKSHPNFNVFEYKREFKPTYSKRVAEHALILSVGMNTVNELPKKLKGVVKQRVPDLATRVQKSLAFLRGR